MKGGDRFSQILYHSQKWIYLKSLLLKKGERRAEYLQKEAKDDKSYNLSRCTYVEVQEWLKETDVVIRSWGVLRSMGKRCHVLH